MDDLLPESVRRLRDAGKSITLSEIAPKAAETDKYAEWPAHSMQALVDAGLTSLHVPKRLGGHEQGLLALAVLGETIAQGCASSSLCFAMHCVGTAVIAAKATRFHEEQYLIPIAEKRHITTLALSEHGTGAHFYLPQTEMILEGDSYVVNGTKQFVTNGCQADSYVVSTMAGSQQEIGGEFSCLIIDKGCEGMQWLEPWSGFGMRGNSSRPMQLKRAKVPVNHLLGQEGDQIWYTFEVVAPYFLIAMAGAYIGIAIRAFDIAKQHMMGRYYTHSGGALADVPALQFRLAEMALALEKSRGLLYRAAYKGDIGNADAMRLIIMAKADAADLAVYMTNEAMTCCGGMGYRENGEISRLLRDARAGHVMSPTTDILKLWAGRLMLDQPLL